MAAVCLLLKFLRYVSRDVSTILLGRRCPIAVSPLAVTRMLDLRSLVLLLVLVLPQRSPLYLWTCLVVVVPVTKKMQIVR